MNGPRPRILLLNVPRLLRDILETMLGGDADVAARELGPARGANVDDAELVITCDEPPASAAVLRRVIAERAATRYLALSAFGARATRYTLEPRAEPIPELTRERLLAEVASLRRGAPDHGGDRDREDDA